MSAPTSSSYPEPLTRYMWNSRQIFRRGLAFALLRTVVVAPIPWLFQVIIDEHVKTGNIGGVASTSVMVVGLLLLHYAFAVAGTVEISRQNGLLMMRLRSGIFNKLHFLNFSYLDRQKTGRLLSKYAFDTQKIEGITMQIVNQFLPNLLYSFTLTVLLIVLHWQLSLLIMLMMPLYAIARNLFNSRLQKANEKTRLAQEKLTGAASEAIGALRLVRSLGEEDQITQHIDSHSYTLTRTRFDLATINSIFNTFAFTTVQFLTLVALAGGAIFAIQGTMTMGTMFAFMAGLPIVLMPVQMLSTLIEQFYMAQEGYRSVKELLDSDYVEDWNGRKHPEPFTGQIQLDRVEFAYPGTSRQVIDQLSLEIPAGSHVALVGPSGSGKSTIAQLILGLYKPDKGTIRIDGLSQQELDMRWLRRQCAVVLQDIVLFSGTIADNIRFARPDATDEEVQQAARMANAESFINVMPEGYNTIVGERGAMLSGGQRQRLSIARAILRNPRILIMDEATSALDYESEQLVQQAMTRVARGRTLITIAHRLSTIRQADQIVVLREGSLAEQGTYDELASRGGLFSGLLCIQENGRAEYSSES